jgi:hypothetical protein
MEATPNSTEIRPEPASPHEFHSVGASFRAIKIPLNRFSIELSLASSMPPSYRKATRKLLQRPENKSRDQSYLFATISFHS